VINCLAGHLLAAQLDVANGSSICITGVIFQANQLLTKVGYAGPASYTISATRRGQPRSLEQELDNYTNDSTSTSC
jgi:Na+-transporting NADH:ubiquinone oxidoreductase subunit NqrA